MTRAAPDRIYLDYNASTPIAPEVATAMQPFLSDHFGNPSSGHWAGQPAREALLKALNDRWCAVTGCRADELVVSAGDAVS